MNLKILSWNIWGGQHLPAIIEFLGKEKPDIIGLQEVIEDLNGADNVAKTIAQKLRYEWFFHPTYEVETKRLYHLLKPRTVRMGNAILSKYRMGKTKTHRLSDENARFAVEADIKVESRNLHFFSTHFQHTHQQPSALQERQAKNLLKAIPHENAIVMGDFNATPESACLAIMNAGMKNTDTKFKPTWSIYSEGCPVCRPKKLDTRLDYIFTTPDLKASHFTAHHSEGSDHLPISIHLKIETDSSLRGTRP